MPRRSSTADTSHDRVHRRSPRGVWGRADLQSVANRAPSAYRAHAAKRADPAKLSARAKQDAIRKIEIRRVFAENFDVYGVRKVWRQLRRPMSSAVNRHGIRTPFSG